LRIVRSMLFVPGNNMRMIHKSSSLDTDSIILDLEDAVPVAEKETARIFVRDSVELVKRGGADVYVRVNALSSGLVQKDLDMAIREGLDGIVLPKCETRADILKIEDLIREKEVEQNVEAGVIGILPLLETAKGVLSAYDIASASSRVIALGFGAVDYTRDMRVAISKEGVELLYPRSHIAVASRAAGIQAVDSPWIDILDKEGLTKDSSLARQLGFNGKMLIHPSQIDVVNRIFSPSEAEIEYARKIIAAHEQAEARGLGATSLDQKMIDIATFRQAQELLVLAERISEKQRKRVDRS